MTTITITVTELAHRCGISEAAARSRLQRFKVGLICKDELLHQGPMRSAGTGRPPAHPDDCELAMKLGVSISCLRSRRWRASRGLLAPEEIYHPGPLSTTRRCVGRSSGRRPRRKTNGKGSPEWHALADKPRGDCPRDRAFDKRLSDARCNEIWRADQESMRAAGLTTEI